jgi:hypothetical protein
MRMHSDASSHTIASSPRSRTWRQWRQYHTHSVVIENHPLSGSPRGLVGLGGYFRASAGYRTQPSRRPPPQMHRAQRAALPIDDHTHQSVRPTASDSTTHLGTDRPPHSIVTAPPLVWRPTVASGAGGTVRAAYGGSHGPQGCRPLCAYFKRRRIH